MRIIVSDASCLIDLQRDHILEVFLELPFEFVIPDVIFDDELVSFTRVEKALLRKHMTIAGLDGDGVTRVSEILIQAPALSVHDGFAFVVAEENPGSILLTGDRRLRNLAESEEIEVHGVLWVIQQLDIHKQATRKQRLTALEIWRDDPACRLPPNALGRMIARLQRSS
ncbi:MAG: hypothetical protein KDD69_12245 [Bdellovibrionales bacterium]|nr:hypothetical protein [Bdellovibrionales bacterium]